MTKKFSIISGVIALVIAIAGGGVIAPSSASAQPTNRISVGQRNVQELRNGDWRLHIDDNCHLVLSRGTVPVRRTTASRNNCTNPAITLRRSNNGNGNRVFFSVVTGGNNVSRAAVGSSAITGYRPAITNIRLTDTGELRAFDSNNRMIANNLQNAVLDETIIAQSQITFPNRQLTRAERQTWVEEYQAMGGPTTFELEVIRLVNEFRASNGRSPLQIDEHLGAAARFYVQTMANLNTVFSHFAGPDGGSGGVQSAFGIASGNRSMNRHNALTPEEIVASWRRSPGHEAGMLAGNNYVGVGTYLAANGRLFTYFMNGFNPSGPLIPMTADAQLAAINEARAAAGISPLQWDQRLATAAAQGPGVANRVRLLFDEGLSTRGAFPVAGNLAYGRRSVTLDPDWTLIGIDCEFDVPARTCRALLGRYR